MKRLFFLLLIFTKTFIYSQRETDNWYFGNKAGINFNNGVTEILHDSKMNTPAGCTSISDSNGRLLFYSNGESIWNSRHEVMENGTNLAGDINFYQNSIIIPKPNSQNVFYIFYVRDEPKTSAPLQTPGLFYSEIIFSQAHPLGIVSLKNVRLLESTSSRISAVHHSNGNDIWLATYGNLYSNVTDNIKNLTLFKISETGISRVITHEIYKSISNLGDMKFSPDGTKLAIADSSSDSLGRYIVLLNFNSENGDINLNTLINPDLFGVPISPKSIEFSQNSKSLFYSSDNLVVQYAFSHSSNDPLFERKKLIGSSNSIKFGSLQLAQNGKIYIASVKNENESSENNKISVINSPNKIGSETNFTHLSFDLTPNYSERGLPNFIQSYFRNRIITENKCVFDFFNFKIDTYAPFNNIIWDFGDGNTSELLEPVHSYNSPGRYIVSAEIFINNQNIKIFKEIVVYPLPTLLENQSLVQCDNDNDGISSFNLLTISDLIGSNTSDLLFYKSYDDMVNNINIIETPENFINDYNSQEIHVLATNNWGCSSYTSFTLEVNYSIPIALPSYSVCDSSDNIENNNEGEFDLRIIKNNIRDLLSLNSTIKFYETYQNSLTSTQELLNIYTSSTKTIWVKIENEAGCLGISQLDLIVNPSPRLEIQDEYKICIDNNEISTIYADQDNDRFEWRNSNNNIISTNNWLDLTNIGDFSLTVYKTENGIECSNTKNFTVKYHYPPEFTQLQIESDNNSNSIFIEVEGDSSYEFSLDGDIFLGSGNSYTFLNIPSGIYTVYVRDKYKCEPSNEKNISIIGYPNFFTPNNDGKNDIWNIYGLSNQHFNKIDIKIFNRYGKVIHQINETNHTNGWNGYYNGYKLPPNTYWFSASLIDINNNVINKTGNFSLIE